MLITGAAYPLEPNIEAFEERLEEPWLTVDHKTTFVAVGDARSSTGGCS
jgi:hypothetical protein